MTTSSRKSGEVIRLLQDKGFGFIREDGTGTEFFFHRSGFNGDFSDLRERTKVTFDSVPSAKGARAENVDEKD